MSLSVLHLIDSGGLYGAEMMLLDLAEEQMTTGMKPLILSTGLPGEGEKPLEQEARKRGVPIKTVRMHAGLNLIRTLEILSFARQKKFDVLHSHGYKFNILVGAMPRFIRKIPAIATLHGYTTTKGLSRIRIYQLVERFLLRRLDGVVFVSAKIKSNPVLKGFKARKTAIILNGIDAAKVRKSANAANSISLKDAYPELLKSYFIVGAIGRLSFEKGFDILIDAFAKVVEDHPQARLLIIGEGELRPDLEKQIDKAGLSKMVKLTGFIKPIHRVMAELDGIVMPSLTEGLPITLLEACILNKSIVASDVGSIAEILKDYEASEIIQPGDKNALVHAIKSLIISKAGRQVEISNWPHEKYSASLMSQNYQKFYETVINAF